MSLSVRIKSIQGFALPAGRQGESYLSLPVFFFTTLKVWKGLS